MNRLRSTRYVVVPLLLRITQKSILKIFFFCKYQKSQPFIWNNHLYRRQRIDWPERVRRFSFLSVAGRFIANAILTSFHTHNHNNDFESLICFASSSPPTHSPACSLCLRLLYRHDLLTWSAACPFLCIAISRFPFTQWITRIESSAIVCVRENVPNTIEVYSSLLMRTTTQTYQWEIIIFNAEHVLACVRIRTTENVFLFLEWNHSTFWFILHIIRLCGKGNIVVVVQVAARINVLE